MIEDGHVREELGAYVLGALDSHERRTVESHVGTCEVCRDELARLSGMPGLLDRLTTEEVMTDLASVSLDMASASTTAVDAVRRSLQRRVRRWQWATAAAASVAVLAVAALIGPFDGEASTGLPEPLVLELQPMAADAAAVDGTVSTYAWEWGTTVEIEVAGLPERSGYVLWAVGEDGERQTAGVWGPTPARKAQVRGASAIQRDDLHAVEVRDESGDLLLATSMSDG